jgi:high-affinity iron transporter
MHLNRQRVLQRLGSPLALMAVAFSTAGILGCSQGPSPSTEAGRDLFRQNGCGSCHGPDGHGNGPVAKTIEPQPRDFRDASAFTQGTDVASIASTIATGVMVHSQGNSPADQHHRQLMPQFNHLSEAERRSLAMYVISLRNPKQPERNQP